MLTFTPQHSDLQREQLLETVRPEPLDDKEIYTLLADLPAPLAEHIAGRVTGFPFLAEELARQISSDGASTETFTPTLPTSVKHALAERLWRISRACRHLLDDASVLNPMFTFDELERMVKADTTLDLAGESLANALDEALRLHLLKEVVQTDRIVYHFLPVLLGSYLYQISLGGGANCCSVRGSKRRPRISVFLAVSSVLATWHLCLSLEPP